MKTLKLLPILFLVLLTACATIMKGGKEEVAIETVPAGASVETGHGKCSTPCTIELKRRKDYTVTIQKPGYKQHVVEINGNSWDPWLWGNFITIIPIGIIVDFYTGNAYDFEPKDIHHKLRKEQQ